jgi:hypothetical protein
MSRFTDSRGRPIPICRLPNGVRSLWQVFLRRSFGIYPELPWIPFAAIPCLERVITREAFVWEIGAGMSTLWLARHAGRVVSIEADQFWHTKLQSILAAKKITNVDLRFEWVAERMCAFTGVDDHSIDFLFVDGGPRAQCLIEGFRKVKAGGHIYLDNWDVAAFWPGAEEFLTAHHQEIVVRQGFVDYVPGNFAVNEGLFLQKSGQP